MNFLSKKELLQEYPLLCKIFGVDFITVERITCVGKAAAHMIFAPILEQKLKADVRERMLDEYSLVVSLKRKPKRKIK